MKKSILVMIRKNTRILLGAAILALWIFYVVNNPNIFTASILSLQEQNFIIDKWWDIAYKTNSGYLDIFMAEKLKTPTNIKFTISFDKDTITIDPASISGQGLRTFNLPDQETIIIQSLPNQKMDKTQSLIMLPFTGDSEDIILTEAVVDEKWLSIGSLNKITEHSK